MRLFVAISLPDELRAQLGQLTNGLPGARWVNEESLHLTLRFLGELDGALATDVDEALAGLSMPAFDLDLAGVDHFAEGRKVRITKVPFAANTRSLIDGYPAGFVKVISDPATRVVLGGTVVGHRASELIAPIALAVTARLRVDLLFDTIMVHPSLSESISEAAE